MSCGVGRRPSWDLVLLWLWHRHEPRPAVDVYQAPVVIVVDGGAQDAHVDLLTARVVHVLGVGGGENQVKR